VGVREQFKEVLLEGEILACASSQLVNPPFRFTRPAGRSQNPARNLFVRSLSHVRGCLSGMFAPGPNSIIHLHGTV